MKWILIVWFLHEGGSGIDTTVAITALDVEFNSQEACESAGEAIQSEKRQFSARVIDEIVYICVSKGQEIAAN